MEKDEKYVSGLIVKAPHEKAPDFIIGKLSVKVEDFIAYLQKHDNKGWVNFELKRSKEGKLYIERDTWLPTGSKEGEAPQPTKRADDSDTEEIIDIDSIPF